MSNTAPAPGFWDQALCTRVQDPDMFHPGAGQGTVDTARWICRRCPVRQRCLEWAMSMPDYDDQYGIYGGLGPTERRDLRKQRQEEYP